MQNVPLACPLPEGPWPPCSSPPQILSKPRHSQQHFGPRTNRQPDFGNCIFCSHASISAVGPIPGVVLMSFLPTPGPHLRRLLSGTCSNVSVNVLCGTRSGTNGPPSTFDWVRSESVSCTNGIRVVCNTPSPSSPWVSSLGMWPLWVPKEVAPAKRKGSVLSLTRRSTPTHLSVLKFLLGRLCTDMPLDFNARTKCLGDTERPSLHPTSSLPPKIEHSKAMLPNF